MFKKKYNLEEFDDEEFINYSIFNENNKNIDESNNFEEEIDDFEDIEDLNSFENFEEIVDLNDFENIGYEVYDNLDYIEILDGNPIENSDIKDKNKTFNLNTDINVVPEIKIEVIKDSNEEKLVKFSLNVILDNEKEENIVIDLNISQKTYLMIAEELFK
jgi:hypothetical protein